jgi:hypothetical protein
MSGSITPSFEMNCPFDTAPADRKNGIAGLVRPLIDSKLPATVLEHLRHERHTVESPVAVEGPQDFVFGSDFDPIAHL